MKTKSTKGQKELEKALLPYFPKMAKMKQRGVFIEIKDGGKKSTRKEKIVALEYAVMMFRYSQKYGYREAEIFKLKNEI